MRILVTGANGQVGHELLRALAAKPSPSIPLPAEGGRQAHLLRNEGGQREALGGCSPPLARRGSLAGAGGWTHYDILPATRSGTLEDGTSCERIDLADAEGLRDALDRIAPDLIINAAAYTAVDRAEDEPERAQRINADAVGNIGAWAAQNGARVVHYSTDYVFDGTATRPYREQDPTHPLGVYGRSKLAGETALRDSGARYLVFRTAWVYAARGKNFPLTMLRLGAERDELRVVDDQIGAPTPASLIANVTAQAVARWYAPPSAGDAQPPRTSPPSERRGGAQRTRAQRDPRSGGGMPTLDGTYHLVASGQTSWCGFARAIFERATQAGLLARAPHVAAIATADYPTRAERPAYSVLDTTKLRTAFGVELPGWQTALDGVIATL